MLSIIICSRDFELYQKVFENIKLTVGVPYEIIRIDNAVSQYGICKAYNLGAMKSKYPNLCFAHEDISFHTMGWGKNVCQWLNDQNTGVIGVAGSTIKTRSPSPFWEWQMDERIFRRNIIQHYPEKKIPKNEHTNPKCEDRSEVVALDGVWFCCRKEVWQNHKFDEDSFQEFHFYDIDFSFHVGFSYKNYVVYDILIEHFSSGSINHSFIKNALIFAKKWYSTLPQHKGELTKEEVNIIQYRSFSRLIKHLAENHYGIYVEIQILWFILETNGFLRKSSYRYLLTFLNTRNAINKD